MKLIVIGDLHGNPIWKKIVEKHAEEDNTLFIFLGDYFDSYIYSCGDQVYNFNQLLEFKKANPGRVILLIGNHDHLYLPQTPEKAYISGYQGDAKAENITYNIYTNTDYLQPSFAYENILFTHAGASKTWIERISTLLEMEQPEYTANKISLFINKVWKNSTYFFNYLCGGDPTGDNPNQSPIWIRPRSLMRDNQEIKNNLIQVVGHTGQSSIDIKGKSTGGRYYFIDTINTSGEYLIIENNEFFSEKI